MNKFIKIVFLFLLVTSYQSATAQFRLIVELVVTDEGKKMAGSEIKVYNGSSLVETVLTDAKGRADIAVPANSQYTIDIGGNKGLIKKKLSIDTRNVPPELGKGDIPYPAEVELFQKIDGLDLAILNKPIGKIQYSDDYQDFGADPAYTKTMQKQLAQLEKDFLAKRAEQEKAAAGKKKEYDAAIKIADKAFADEDWEKAEEQYKIAEKVNPDPLETYPSFQLAELQTKLIKIRADNKRYDEAIAKADEALAAKDYEIAVMEYKRASGYKPKEAYPKDKLKSTQDLLANAAKVEQNYLAAIEKGDNALKINDMATAKAAFTEALSLKSDETYPKNKIAEIDDILAKADAKKAEYDNAIKAADAALAAKDFTTAKAEYTKAKGLKPTETYPVDQLAKVDVMMANAAKLEQDYLAAIEKGDQALKANDFTNAKTAFEAAAKLKPEEVYPKDKIKEINDFIAKNEAVEKEYQDKITAADKALESKDYEGAKTAYSEAKTLKPTETYPQTKLTEIDGILADLAKAEENYKKAIANGDKALAAKDFETAKAAFTEASNLKPEEQYPKDKLGEIDTIVLSNKQAEADYAKALQNGEDAIANKDFEKAKEFFNEALTLKPEEQMPKDKLAEIDKIIAEAAAKDKNFADAVTEGDKAMEAKDFEGAKVAYTKALSIKPEETYPQDQLGKIDVELEKLAAEKANAEKLEADYQAAVKEGDEAFASKDLVVAKTAFEKAATLKPEEAYPKEKIAAIDTEIAAQAENEKNYTDAIAEGDNAMESKDFEAAKAGYTKALSIKPEETYPQDQLGKIDAELEKIAEEKANAEKLEADYAAAIKEGDAAFESQDLQAAKVAFEKALGLKAEEAYPKDKIATIDAQLGAEAEKEANYSAAIEKGDAAMSSKEFEAAKTAYTEALSYKPEETYPQDQLAKIDVELEKIAAEKANAEELEANYNSAIEEGDNLFAAKNYDDALLAYNKALELKNGEEYPTNKITEINAAKEALAAENAAAEEAEAIKKQYDDLIAKADAAFEAENLEEAKADYTAAKAIKADETYPQDQISKIDEALAAAASANEAEANYQAAITEGDNAFNSDDFETAKAGYLKALSIKPEETYPQDQLSKIDEALAAAAIENEAESNYQAAITEGDNAFNSDDFETAKAGYLKALSIKPEETYPQDQLSKIDEALAAAASANEAEANYQAAITEGDNAFNSDDFETAKAGYLKALSIKPEETYPQDQLSKIDEALAAAASANEAEANYQAAIIEGDNAFNSDDFETAKAGYLKALSIKPEETYPQDQLSKIDEALAAAASANEVEANYQAAITEGDNAFNSDDFETAKAGYLKALSIKPEETYPQEQLSKIDEAIATASANEAEANYQAAITEGDNAFNSNEFESAKAGYLKALSIKPEETYPQEQLSKIDEAIAAAEAEEIRLKNEKANELDAEYQAAISEGDESFNSQNYEAAKAGYLKALSIKPEETYPQDQLSKIDEAIAAAEAEEIRLKNEKANELDAEYQAAITEGDESFNSQNYEAAKTGYLKALSIKPEETYPQDQLSKIDEALAAVANAEAKKKAEEARLAKLEADYLVALAEGDDNLANNELEKALKGFERAVALKPSESYPQEKINEINELINEQNAANAAELAEKQAQYDQLIVDGQLLMESKDYKNALETFKKAQNVKPDEILPAQKISEIEDLLARLEEEKNQIRIQQEQAAANQAAYATAIAAGDKYFAAKEWNEAENEYRMALGLIATETYPQEQLDKIQAILDQQSAEILAAQQAKQDALNAERKYKKLIASGNEFFQDSEYASARTSFKQALAIKPDEAYPKAQIAMLDDLIEKERLAAIQRRKDLDKPIKIQTGPKSEIDGSAEAEIERMYEELWAKQNSNKNADLEDKQKVIDSIQLVFSEREMENREIATQFINDIQISIEKSKENSPEFHKQNYESVKLKQEDLTSTYQRLGVEAERIRNDNYLDQQTFYEGLSDFNKRRGEEILEGKREMVTNELDEVETSEIERSRKQSERILASFTKNENLKKAIREFNEEIYDEFYMRNYERLQSDEELYTEEQQKEVAASNERTLEQLEKSNELAIAVRQFGEKNADGFKNNQLAIEEQEKALQERTRAYNEEAEKRRKEKENEEFYIGEKKIREDQSAADYPQGVTEEVIENQNGSTTIRRIVVEGTQTDIYEKSLYKWGGIFYTKNGNNITKDIWDKESK